MRLAGIEAAKVAASSAATTAAEATTTESSTAATKTATTESATTTRPTEETAGAGRGLTRVRRLVGRDGVANLVEVDAGQGAHLA